MAVTGKFDADFASFFDACQKAEVSLRGFEAGAGKVESSLNRMVDNFSGRKIISEATLMAEAVERVGGVSKFTQAELAKIGGVAAEAAEKLKAWGQDVPKNIQDLATHAKTATSAFESMKGVVSDLAAGFVAMFSARAAFNFVRDTINEASALKDLGQQTHINVEELQVLAGGMSEFGVDAETLGRGLYKLSRGIAGGDESVAHGLHLMGMSLEDVAGLNGQELFLKIEHGLATLQGGLRDTASAELFGGKLGSAMAGAAEGIDGAIDKWRQLNHVVSAESVDAMDTFGESITRAQKNLSSMAANVIGPLTEGFNTLFEVAEKGATKWAIAKAVAEGYYTSLTGMGRGAGALASLLDDLNTKTEANTKKTTTAAGAHRDAAAAVDLHGQAVKFMAALELDSAKPILLWQKEYLDHLKDVGILTAQNAAGIGVSATQLAKYSADRAAAEAEFKKVEADQLTNAKILDDFRHEAHTRQVEIVRIQTDAQIKQAGVVNAAVQAEFEAQTKLNVEWGLNASGALALQDTALKTLTRAMDELHARKVEGISQEKEEQVLINTYTRQLYDEARAHDTVAAAVNGATQSHWAEVDALFAVAQAAAAAIGMNIGSVGHRPGEGPGINGGKATSTFSLGGPFTLAPPVVSSHKDGGPVDAGLAMLHDNEYVVPSGGALVMRGGGVTVHNVFNIVDTADNIARRTADLILRTVKQGTKLGA